jgi:hypothetical protein
LFHAGPAHGVFPFKVDPTRRAGHPLEHPSPPAVEPATRSPRATRCVRPSGNGQSRMRAALTDGSLRSEALHFRVLIPASVRTRRRRFRPTDRPRPSWGCSSLGGSPSPAEASPEAYPLSCFTSAAHAKADAAPQSVDAEEVGLTPSSLPPLSRFLHLVDIPDLRRETSKSNQRSESTCKHIRSVQ